MRAICMIMLLTTAFHVASATVTLRIRLSSGVMQRLEVDEEIETIDSLRQRLQNEGIILGDDSSFTLKDQSYSALSVSASLDSEQLSIGKLGITSGDILSIVRSAAMKEKQLSSDPDSASQAKGQKISRKSNQKKPTSIADLEKKRKELLKITRQKGTNGRAVSMTASAGRILERMANSGGYAMLLGRTVKATPIKASSKRGNSIAAISKLEKSEKETVEISAVCEIFLFSDPNLEESYSSQPPVNLNDLPAVAVFTQIAKALGLSVVGCCVSMPKDLQVKEGKPVMWTSDHVFAALQLRSAGQGSKEETDGFVVISVCKAVSSEDIPADTPKKKILKRLKPLVADGISLEAFQLSDQANILCEKEILPVVRIRSTRVSSFSSFSAKTNAMKSLAMKAMANSGSAKEKGVEKEEAVEDKIELDGEILIQTSEAKSVDPFLLAVPLPIRPLKPPSPASKARKPEIEDTVDSGFEHSFPSDCEMSSNENTAKVAKLHFSRILSSLSQPGTKDRMRDPHLLYYMSKILDVPTRDALCRSLIDGTDRFPGLVKVALDMIKMSIDNSRSDSNSVGKRSGRFVSDDDEDSDE